MLSIEQDESTYRISYASYLPLLMLSIPPALVYEQFDKIVDGSITNGELIGIGLGFLIPLLAIAYWVEFGSFYFSKSTAVFRWTRRNLWRKQSVELPLNRVVKIDREARECGDSAGLQTTYRLLVTLDDGDRFPLSHGYSALYADRFAQIVTEARTFLGMPET